MRIGISANTAPLGIRRDRFGNISFLSLGIPKGDAGAT